MVVVKQDGVHELLRRVLHTTMHRAAAAAALASELEVRTCSSSPTGSQRWRAMNAANKAIKRMRVENTAFR